MGNKLFIGLAEKDKNRKSLKGNLSSPIIFYLIIFFLFGLLSPFSLQAQKRVSLFYFEAQGVASWNLTHNSIDLFSYNHHHLMQKPGIGLEALYRFRRQQVDFGYLSLQTRLVYQKNEKSTWAFQLYNAFINLKTGLADLRFGHLKPALGLNYLLDNHALLLPDATMFGFALDRDWGLALHKDWSWGDSALSLTTGSGHKLEFNGNFLFSTRLSYGVLARDNYSLGISGFVGKVLEMNGMDDHPLPAMPASWTGLAMDVSYFWLNLESRAEVNFRKREGKSDFLFLFRQGLFLLPEGRLKLEAQASFFSIESKGHYSLASGLSYRINPDLTFRSMLLYDYSQKITRLVLQFYYYRVI